MLYLFIVILDGRLLCANFVIPIIPGSICHIVLYCLYLLIVGQNNDFSWIYVSRFQGNVYSIIFVGGLAKSYSFLDTFRTDVISLGDLAISFVIYGLKRDFCLILCSVSGNVSLYKEKICLEKDYIRYL